MKNVRKHRDIKVTATEKKKEPFNIKKKSYLKMTLRKSTGNGNE